MRDMKKKVLDLENKLNSKNNHLIFSTIHSNLKTRSDGSSVNDFKLFLALAKNFNVIPIYRNYDPKNSFFKNFLATIIRDITILKFSLIPKQTFILRGPETNFLPCLLKRIMKHKIYLSLGCTPVLDVENRAFKKNIEFNQILKNLRSFKRILYILDSEFFHALIQAYQFKKADKFIVENNAAKRILEHYVINNSKIYILPYYVNHFFLKGSNPPYDPNSNKPFKLGYTGRFSLYDNLIPIIDAIKIINKDSFKVKLILIGDGLTRRMIEERINNENLTMYFEFRGNLKHNKLAKSLDEFHCLILPMVENINPSTIAIKILEGVMNKKVIITTKSGNNKSLFPPNYDLILPKLTVNELIKAIHKVMKNYEAYKTMMNINQKLQLGKRSFLIIQNVLKSIINEESN